MESTISNPDFSIEEEELKRTKHRKTETRDLESDPKPETISGDLNRSKENTPQSSSKLSAKTAAIPPPRRRQPSSPPPPPPP
ncbi:hypothetical protein CFP56_043354 [Quercus suber]|uniref:Uncharacterized protein n=1 Tax=Quercus suber TaxID=58331 RepID=A0AAW0L3K9_QUESU